MVMNSQARRFLPPMAALHAFAAAARTGSFSRAATEIGLTQGAVSRQVAQLEEWLGKALFDRHGRRVVLNRHGQSYAEAIAPALSSIRRATREALNTDTRHVVELATLPSFGMRWLAPRLPLLSAVHPDIVVNLTARSDEFDFAREPFDVAIHFGRPIWPNAELYLLFQEECVPVVSAALADKLAQPNDITALPLLTLRTRTNAWKDWLEHAGVGAPPPVSGGTFDQFLMMAQAVAAGAGAALIPRFLIEPELASGSLVVPFDIALKNDHAYYLVRPLTKGRPGTDQFVTWLTGVLSV